MRAHVCAHTHTHLHPHSHTGSLYLTLRVFYQPWFYKFLVCLVISIIYCLLLFFNILLFSSFLILFSPLQNYPHNLLNFPPSLGYHYSLLGLLQYLSTYPVLVAFSQFSIPYNIILKTKFRACHSSTSEFLTGFLLF